jgi:hypothetical protein
VVLGEGGCHSENVGGIPNGGVTATTWCGVGVNGHVVLAINLVQTVVGKYA